MHSAASYGCGHAMRLLVCVGACLVALAGTRAFAQEAAAQGPMTQSPATQTPVADGSTPVADDSMPDGPAVSTPLPGSDYAQLISRAYYISPFAALFGVSSSNGGSAESQNNDVSRYFRSGRRRGMSRVPEMFGDFRAPGVRLTATSNTTSAGSVTTDIPVAAGTAGLRIAENNHAMPNSRLWFAFHHFHNAWNLRGNSGFGQATRDQSVNRFTIAGESLIDDGTTSVELRMTFGSAINRTEPLFPGAVVDFYQLDADSVGNLSVILKRLLLGDANRAWSAGLGIETPTGSDAFGSIGLTDFIVETQAVQLTPFSAMTWRSDRWFGHLFSQLDISVAGDTLIAGSGGNFDRIGEIDRGVTLGTDIGLGYWICPPKRGNRTGWAAVTELHHTTTLDDPSSTFANLNGNGAVEVNLNDASVSDLLNLTSGLQWTHPGGYAVRSGIAVPLRDERIFDTEFILQLNRAY